MENKFIFKTFFLFIFICVCAAANSAQEKPQALKFDEFSGVFEQPFYSKSSELVFRNRVERFSRQLEKERGVSAYVIYYQARISYRSYGWQIFLNQVNGIENEIKYNSRIKVKDVLIVDGGYRENNSVEFWIVPEHAEGLPAPTPTFDKTETHVCPVINVGNDTAPGATETAKFSVQLDNFREINDYSLRWQVSVGEIVSGQKTNAIEVKINNPAAKRVTAYVEISGLPFPCPKFFSTTAEINSKFYQVDSFGQIANGDTKARLDNFFMYLLNHPMAKGYVIIYGNRAERKRDVARVTALVANTIRFRNFDASRINIENGGFREDISTELWLSFNEMERPIFTPTVDEKFIVAPRPSRKSRPRKK